MAGFLVAALVSLASASVAQAETRSLKLYFIHTKERAEIVYKRNGRFDQNGLNQINRFLRDWRRNEPAKMDPRLLDLVWSVYRSVGARDYIHVVSAYRSPATNAALRSRSSGVAEKSQHMLGKAMDFYIPGVPLNKLRAAAFKAEGGGVGYYPKSGSPFVHLDVGNVRAWPRMSRSELMALFPDGRTIHVPTDGKPLPGFQQALAAYEQRKRSGGQIQVASLGNSRSNSGEGAESGNQRTVARFLSNVFRGGGADEDEDSAEQSAPVAVAAAPARREQRATPPAEVAAPAQPDQRAPEAIIAALPARSVPVPGAAPRPLVDIGAAPAQPLIAGLPAQAAAPAPVEAAPVEVAFANVPLPTRRPNYEPEVQLAAAGVPVPVAAIAGERPRGGGSEAIADLLASTTARADVVINEPPVPGLRPKLAETAEAPEIAAAGREGDVFVLASLPSTEASAAPTAAALLPEGPKAAALGASPRVALLGRDVGATAADALDSGVRTTTKSAKPRATEARPDPKAVVMPVEHELTRWAFKREVTVANAGGSKRPSAAHSIVWSAPSTVYTAGFQQAAPANAETSRFTGKAVTFMSVAKFATN